MISIPSAASFRMAMMFGFPAMLLLTAVLVWWGKVPLHYSIRNLAVRWRTTIMTAMAFTLVVSLLTVMLAFVNGMYRLTDASGHAENVIILSDGATDEIFSSLKPIDVSDIETQPGICHDSAGRPLASREVYLVVNQAIPDARPGRPKRRFLQLRGIENPQIAAQVHGLEIYPGGTWFSQAGVQQVSDASGSQSAGDSKRSLIQAVLGEGIAREMGRNRTAEQLDSARNRERLDVGDTFFLDNRPWVIVGVMQSAGSTFDSEVWAKSSVVGPMFGKETLTSVVVRTDSADGAKELRKYFTEKYAKAALQAQVETDYFSALGETSKQFLYAVVFVTAVMAIGGVFGVMNTMFAAISHRTKDIGVLRLLGYARWQILAVFLIESLLIALVGGLLGCALGMLTDGWSATSVVSSGPGGGKFVVLKLSVDANVLSAGLLMTIVMGVLGGILPALSAVRLRPLDALR